MRKLIFATIAFVLAAQPGFAGSRLVVDALEEHSSQFDLPETESSRVSFKRCGDCPVQYATANAATVFAIGKYPVTLAQLKAFVAEKPRMLVVSYRVADNVLTRITAH